MKVKLLGDENPYSEIICTYFAKQFHRSMKLSPSQLLDTLTDIIVGDKSLRYGPIPKPESLVVIRSVIETKIEQLLPIPILVPWGSIKSDFSGSVDVAEVSAIGQLLRVAHTVKQYYAPGVEIVVRVEDTSGLGLFKMEASYSEIHNNSFEYSRSMDYLVRLAAGEDVNMKVVKESQMPNATKFSETVENLVPFFLKYLEDTDTMEDITLASVTPLGSYEALRINGWKGIISREQRDYYYNSYRKLYPWNEAQIRRRLAMYFAGSLTRHQLNMTGKLPHWENSFIQAAFLQSIPGVPKGYNSNYVFYRTIPLEDGRTHMPPWRSKGYIEVTGRDTSTKITSIHNKEIIESLNKVIVQASTDTWTLLIRADYVEVGLFPPGSMI
jgi:hypothetical protein